MLPMETRSDDMSFWEHLDALRGSLLRMLLVVAVLSIGLFCFKGPLFDVVLAPTRGDFPTYGILETLSERFGVAERLAPLGVRLINTGLAQQFFLHVKVSVYFALLLASPYIIYLLFHFLSPALYSHERRYAIRLALGSYLMFLVGVAVNYFLLFPLTYRFLGTYQISEIVENTVTIESYIDTLLMLSLSLGVVFEIPTICYILAAMGILSAETMRRVRRPVVIASLVVSAIITPTGDAFTLLLVALPMYLLYELSILIIPKNEKELK